MAKRKNKPSIPPHYVLPSDNEELLKFAHKFKVDMMEQVVSSIEFAVSNGLPCIEVFQFKDSDFIITIFEKDYLSNLDNIYGFYLKNESYEKCPRVVKLQQIIKDRVITPANEKTKS